MDDQEKVFANICCLFSVLKNEIVDCTYKHSNSDLCNLISFRKPISAGLLTLVTFRWNDHNRKIEYDPERLSLCAVLAVRQFCYVNNIEREEIDSYFRLISSKFPD